MIEFGSLPSLVMALLIVIIVLIEAVVLYLGYGAVERVVGSTVKDAIQNA